MVLFSIDNSLEIMINCLVFIAAQIRRHNNTRRPSIQPEDICYTAKPKSIDEERRQHEIFNVLCDNIENWRDLGRCLEFKDVELNRIGTDQDLRNDIKLITFRILEQAEKKFGNQFQQKLRLALNDARRKDILRMLKNMNLIE